MTFILDSWVWFDFDKRMIDTSKTGMSMGGFL